MGTPVSSTNKTDYHDITEILLKVTLNIINQPTKPYAYWYIVWPQFGCSTEQRLLTTSGEFEMHNFIIHMYKGLFQDFFSFAATSSLAYSSPSTTGGAPKTQQLNTNSLVHCLIKVVSKDSLREAQLKMVFSLLTTLTLSSECRNIMFKVFYSIFNFFFCIHKEDRIVFK